MRKINMVFVLVLVFIVSGLSSCKSILPDALTGASLPFDPDGNSLYHMTDETTMAPGTLEVAGEVVEPGKVNLKKFYKREVVLREARLLSGGEYEFVGAYRYIGYSLFDLLHPFNHQKKNKEEFRPAIDLYVIIENDKGETVSLSWGEIFFTANPHQILIATESAPIKPYRVDVDYPVEKQWKLVVGTDLFASRQLINPVKITVKSFEKKNYLINRDFDPLYSPEMLISLADTLTFAVNEYTVELNDLEYRTIFYGMGMGHHPNPVFKGRSLNDVVSKHFDLLDHELFRNGLVCFAGIDGYRAIYSFSELFNRVDQTSPMLVVTEGGRDGGRYRIFHPIDFYADRSVKSLAEMYIFTE
jgi:hypothetical protein